MRGGVDFKEKARELAEKVAASLQHYPATYVAAEAAFRDTPRSRRARSVRRRHRARVGPGRRPMSVDCKECDGGARIARLEAELETAQDTIKDMGLDHVVETAELRERVDKVEAEVRAERRLSLAFMKERDKAKAERDALREEMAKLEKDRDELVLQLRAALSPASRGAP